MHKESKIAIIDSHPLQREEFNEKLHYLGYQNIIGYSNASDALSYISKNKVNVIFCNLQMEDEDGIEMMFSLNDINYKGYVVLLSDMDSAIISSILLMCQNFSFKVIGNISKSSNKESIAKILSIREPEKELHTDNNTSIPITEQQFLIDLVAGRIKNYYQPQIDIKEGKLVGVEALARWLHSSNGILLPNIFLPMVEKCDLHYELFQTVLINALKDIKQGKLPYKVSINADYRSLEQPGFASDLIERCKEYEISPEVFTIEITERDTYKNITTVLKNLAKLRVNSVNVSIDDFGTGHSSLQKLLLLPFSEIKIDRSFISHLVNKSKEGHIVSSICELAKSLNLRVVAEGVEDNATLSLLKEYNIDLCQGFFIDKPMPIEALNRAY